MGAVLRGDAGSIARLAADASARDVGVAIRVASATGEAAALAALLALRRAPHIAGARALWNDAPELLTQLHGALHAAVLAKSFEVAALLHEEVERVSAPSSEAAFLRATWESLRGAAEREAGFVAGMQALGVACPKVRIAHLSMPETGRTLRGLQAAVALSAGEEVCSVPLQHALSQTTIILSSFGEGFMQAHPDLTFSDFAAIFLLREAARERSPWKPWLHICADGELGGPRGLAAREAFPAPDGLPAGWDPETDAARLAALSAHERHLASKTRATHLERYDRVFPAAFGTFAAVLSEGVACSGCAARGCAVVPSRRATGCCACCGCVCCCPPSPCSARSTVWSCSCRTCRAARSDPSSASRDSVSVDRGPRQL